MRVKTLKIAMVSRAPVGSYTSKFVRGLNHASEPDHVTIYGRKGENRSEQYVRLVETWTPTRFPFQIFRCLVRDRPDVVHIQHEFGMFGKPVTMSLLPILYLFLKFLHVRTVSTLHTTIFPDSLSNDSIGDLLPIASWIPKIAVEFGLHIVYGSACRLSDAVIVHQKSHKTKLQTYYKINAAKIAFIPHGVGHTEHVATGESLSRWASIIGSKKMALYFGYLSPRKGIDYLIDAFEEFSRERPGWILILAGGISKEFYLPYSHHIKNAISQKGLSNKIVMTGFVPEGDADALFRLCDFVVLPYTQVVGNASACNLAIGYGKPIIASNISPFSEEIENGQHGILCRPQDSREILGAMEKLSSDDEFYRKTCTNLEGLHAQRDWLTVAHESLRLYEAILTGRNAGQSHIVP